VERLRELGLPSLEKRRFRGMPSVGVQKMEPGCFEWCPLTGQEAMGTN